MKQKIILDFDMSGLSKKEIYEILDSVNYHIEMLIKKYGYFEYVVYPLERAFKRCTK
ncbi:MAG: hypothetical protein IJY87_04580 [Bacilli bacterium]|nr:hypothetical protein [Bacilli bacterium]